MGKSDLQGVKSSFVSLIETVQPIIKSQFVAWLDEKVAEFKVNGFMHLDIKGEPPKWIRDYSMSMLVQGMSATDHASFRESQPTQAERATSPPKKKRPPTDESSLLAKHRKLEQRKLDKEIAIQAMVKIKEECVSIGRNGAASDTDDIISSSRLQPSHTSSLPTMNHDSLPRHYSGSESHLSYDRDASRIENYTQVSQMSPGSQDHRTASQPHTSIVHNMPGFSQYPLNLQPSYSIGENVSGPHRRLDPSTIADPYNAYPVRLTTTTGASNYDDPSRIPIETKQLTFSDTLSHLSYPESYTVGSTNHGTIPGQAMQHEVSEHDVRQHEDAMRVHRANQHDSEIHQERDSAMQHDIEMRLDSAMPLDGAIQDEGGAHHDAEEGKQNESGTSHDGETELFQFANPQEPRLPPRKRNVLTMEDRVKVIDCLNMGNSHRSIAKVFGVGKSQILNIMKYEKEILQKWYDGQISGSVRYINRKSQYQDVNDEVWTWYQLGTAQRVKISGKQIQNKALEIAKEKGYTDFSASNGWLMSFRCRHNLKKPTQRKRKVQLNEQETRTMTEYADGDVRLEEHEGSEPIMW